MAVFVDNPIKIAPNQRLPIPHQTPENLAPTAGKPAPSALII
jgi:hypothetical protein